MERGRVNTISKQHFTYLYGPARELVLTKRNILAAWRGSELFPFNPEKVLDDILKPPALTTILKANKTRVDPYPYHVELPTPTMLVLGEALTSLLNMIKHVPNDEGSSQRKEWL
ncbi:hypothetical protein EJ04DRAFT_599359 [Polyplosphaeria fusca]|uniref:Uncharacterized protein n=1 Tax=Polyplosphaeria fusca TaxID=682080 RepID=A0A9P4QKF2_9PLEO|nr:hypothetical protein EJ04DRAFT_599359 [Polyplosphaeria fusca]